MCCLNALRVFLVIAMTALSAAACGPFFPATIIDQPGALLASPSADFAHEIERLKLVSAPPFKAVVRNGKTREELTAEVDACEFAEAIARRNLSESWRQEIINAYRASRSALAKYVDERERSQTFKTQLPTFPDVTIPEGPAEFVLYAQGAVAFHQGKFDEAAAKWQAVLALPMAERKYRSTWAAYMLGRLADQRGARAAAKTYYQRVRELANAEFHDGIGLAAASLGWEAKIEYETGGEKGALKAVRLYLDQAAAGDGWAHWSLQFVADILLSSHAQAAARDPLARPVVMAHILSRGGPFRNAPKPEVVSAWLSAVESAGAKALPIADRLGWIAYQNGQMDIARRWLDRAPADGPVALWLRAKLLLRDGKRDEAAELMKKAAEAFPPEEAWDRYPSQEPRWHLTRTDRAGDSPYTKPREMVSAELGSLQLSRQQYGDALDLLLRNYWTDAAYVAERVMSVAELKRHVDERYSRLDAFEPVDRANATKLRHLLARRLTRQGRWQDAGLYFPEAVRPQFRTYVNAIKAGHDENTPPWERAEFLLTAGRIARDDGMDLMGTELAPDNFIWGGSYEYGGVERERPQQGLDSPVSDDEIRRLRNVEVDPKLRYHYRYVAADLAWEAANLLPEESDERARALCIGGAFLKQRDPKRAQRFYEALVNDCGTTELGKKAKRMRWLPVVK